MQGPSRHMNLMGMLFPGIHMGAWRMPDASPDVDMKIEHYLDLARMCEAAKLDGLFFADAVFVLRSDELLAGDLNGSITPRCASLEPATLLAALAMTTKHLGLVATMTTTYNEPYNVARRFATLDHISHGRICWNVVTSQNESEAGNFGFDRHMLHADRYERAEEFVDVVRGLWHSWDEGAIIRDKESVNTSTPRS